MGLFYDQSSSASPVAVLHPQPHMSQPYNMNTEQARDLASQSHYSQLRSSSSFWPPSNSQQSQIPSSAAGRKRSRDEAADNLEDDSYFPPVAVPIQESEDDWEYGEGMTLIKPNGFIIDASSQTGTWAEEKAEQRQPESPASQRPPVVQDRPNLRNHKSQRLDLTATPVIIEEMNTGDGNVVAASPPKSTGMGLDEPTIDAFTIHLGIGWSKISNDEHIQAAARGWARFIENHYPVNSVQMRLQSKGLASYLVESDEGWFLFGEDLKHGRLVSMSLEKTFENLRTSPPTFDGLQVLVATAETPKNDLDTKQGITMDESNETILANGASSALNLAPEVTMDVASELHHSVAQDVEVEMDMS
jgi:hypothetical protein